MTSYIIRRLLYAIPILMGVNLTIFFLFFFINTPDQMARFHLGSKRITEEQIAKWKRQRDYHLPNFYNNGWTETAVRQVNNKPVNLQLNPQQSGEYQLRIEVPRLDTGTLKVVIPTDKSTALKLPGKGMQGPVEIDMAQTKTFTLPFSIKKKSERNPSPDILLQPSEEAPQSIIRLYFKEEISFLERFTETIFWKKSIQFLFFNFGTSDDGRNIGEEIRRRIIPSLSIAVPSFIIGILVNITFAMLFAFYRGTYIDFWGVITCVAMMSISSLFYIIGGQWLFGKALRLVPVLPATL